MFDVGPEKLLVLLLVALIVLGPDRLPQLARDAARMLRTLRALSRDTRAQFKEHLGPELRDLAVLRPQTLLQQMLMSEDDETSNATGFRSGDTTTAAPVADTRAGRDDDAT